MTEDPTQKDAPDPNLSPKPSEGTPLPPAPETAVIPPAEPKPIPRPKPVPPPKPAPEPAPMPPPAAPAPRSGGAARFFGLLLGGVAAAAAGFGLATYGAREGWPLVLPQTTALQTEVASLREQATALAAAQIDPARLTALESQLASLPQQDSAALEQRLAALESRPQTAADPQVIADLQAQIGTLATRLAEQQTTTTQIAAEIDNQIRQKLEGATTEAEALRQSAERRAALLGLETAMVSGLPLTDSAVRLQDAGIDIPEPLAALIAAPVTLPDLQGSIAEATRAALLAARKADMGDTLTDRLATFLQTQTGARPLAPQEGDTPEAVLSRIEGHVRSGDIAAAREQIASLPPAAQDALAPWATQADLYIAGRAALATLLQE